MTPASQNPPMPATLAKPDTSPKAFLGTGWNFPMGLAKDGSIATAAYEEDVRQSILIILGTNPGERVMRPNFGAGLRDFVFKVMSSTTIATLRQRVRQSLIAWEPRIDVLGVEASVEQRQRGTLLIKIQYRVRSSSNVHNLVYPFYLQEGGGGTTP